MPVEGQSRRFAPPPMTSGLPPEAYTVTAGRHVSKVPKAVVSRERSPNDSSFAPGSTAQIHSCSAGQLVEQCLCGFQISGLEALSEPAKERCEQRAGIPAPPPITPQARQAAGGAELE